jgi:energy-coupling factor transport system permease protein
MRAFVRRTKQHLIPLLAQSIRKAHRIAVAMEAKRFSEHNRRTYYYGISFSHRDIWFVLSVVLFIFLPVWTANWYPYSSIIDVRFI